MVRGDVLTGSKNADIAIIGGGFTGCSAALHAAEAGAKVVLLEAETVGHGASGRNVGYVNAGLWSAPDEVEAILGRASGARLNALLGEAPTTVMQLIERHQIECDAMPVGSLQLADSARGLRYLRNRFSQLKSRGAPVQLLSAEETESRTGTVAYRGALFDARAVIIQPYSYCRGLARAAITAGAEIHEASRVNSVERDGDHWLIKTGAGSVLASKLLNATDAYHQPVNGLKLPPQKSACYFQVATAPLSPEHLRRVLPGKEGCWDTATVMSSFRLDRAGRLVVGAAGSLQHAANSIHTNWAYRKMVSLFPFLNGQPVEYAWYGVIGMTADHLPKVFQLGDYAYAVFGYSGRGIGPGTVFGRELAQYLVHGDVSLLPVPPVSDYAEKFRLVKEIYYEMGSSLAHLIGGRLR